MAEKIPGQHFDFEHVDADAVCEQCGTVNPEETLICKTCGNNLRDQRSRRIAMEQGVPGGEPGVNRVRLFTGILTGLGIVTILAAVIFLQDIEAWLVDRQTVSAFDASTDLWSGPSSEIYDQLMADLIANPTPESIRRQAVEEPVLDESFNGRYVLVRPDALRNYVILGEANLSRRGNRVHFVARMNYRDLEVRGVASLTGVDGEPTTRPVAMNSASVRFGGQNYLAWGYAEPNLNGSHTVYGQSAYHADAAYGAVAYRIR